MKSYYRCQKILPLAVAPLVGAWIEILAIAVEGEPDLSVAPLVGAWIEIECNEHGSKWKQVAPLVGAWIEILLRHYINILNTVAPLVGAWIEILLPTNIAPTGDVAPLVGAWIEIFNFFHFSTSKSSLLSWERGLKWQEQDNLQQQVGRSSRGSVD